ncbi:c-type cytochrome [Magnetovibrio sp. PR-2]|uniref:c-type cytochrome n=1 Tax=Magnetovibrio sp. PR-2 TaxID=3120356 RepID=UPI002FCE1B9E
MKYFITMAAVAAVACVSVFSTSVQAEDQSSIARGGLLYDKWYAVIDAPKPPETHKAWPSSNTKKKGATTWRCKSCHGWDLRGKDGAYASGSYKTGIPGVRGLEGASLDKIVAIIKDDTHGMGGMMSDADYHDLAMFISKGQVDMTKVINADKSVNGDAAKGAAYYNTICAGCHGLDGKLPKELPKPMGKIASGNPWETLAKIMNGQPKESMPALRALPLQVSVDILAYTVTLPQE